MKLCCKRMRRIDQKTYVVLTAELRHRSLVERPGDMCTVLTLNLLKLTARRVPIRRTRRIGHAHCQPSFRRST